ncbi:probable LIM domain-containing serine/threonine-protein kinase DDB_G0286997 isoform X2 [Synchiropus splendidus]|uniref:probable LIM domain-containing serine/threonine-protein kinase DDB_G0286997 isoform X2 n=1 Tax=Synchiropus splendidus TaxID=270530 RepID=UPI00237DE72A|nr:probable LIM domain-containing serine/threonine-protein kinase DDB_G0286997 isoform X2 [Synchiropus splendidus]
MMDDEKEPQTDKGSCDQSGHAPPSFSDSSASSVSGLQRPTAVVEGPQKPSQPTGLVANLKPLACLNQPKRKLLPRPSSNSPLTPSYKAFGIASLNLEKVLPPTSFNLPSQSSSLVLEPSSPSPTCPRPTTSIRSCQINQKLKAKRSRKSASLKLGRSLEASLARIQKFKQRKAAIASRQKWTGRKASPKKSFTLPPPPPPPSPLSPLPPVSSRQCHPIELLIATALLELQEPCRHDEDQPPASECACLPLDLSSRKSKRKIQDDGSGTSEHVDPAESWASYSKQRLFPSLVELFGGEPGSDIPENCVSGMHLVDHPGTQVPAAGLPAGREASSSSDDGDLEESDNTVTDNADNSAMCWENGMEVCLHTGSVEEVVQNLKEQKIKPPETVTTPTSGRSTVPPLKAQGLPSKVQPLCQASEWSPLQVDKIQSPSQFSAVDGQRGRPRKSAPQRC